MLLLGFSSSVSSFNFLCPISFSLSSIRGPFMLDYALRLDDKLKFIGPLAHLLKTDTAIERLEQQVASAFADRAPKVFSADASQQRQGKVGRNLAVKSIGLDPGAE